MKILCVLISLLSVMAYAQEPQPKRPANFEKYEYKYSVEVLGKKFSKKMMKAAKKDMAELYQVNKSGKYKPIIDSLNHHATPEWYKDAKLGIFLTGDCTQLQVMEKKDLEEEGTQIGICPICIV